MVTPCPIDCAVVLGHPRTAEQRRQAPGCALARVSGRGEEADLGGMGNGVGRHREAVRRWLRSGCLAGWMEEGSRGTEEQTPRMPEASLRKRPPAWQLNTAEAHSLKFWGPQSGVEVVAMGLLALRLQGRICPRPPSRLPVVLAVPRAVDTHSNSASGVVGRLPV